MNHYEVLGVPRDATSGEVRHAYLAKIGRLSPDRFDEAPPELTDALARAAETVDEAWRVLGDPDRRAEYDGQLGPDPSTLAGSRRLHAENVWAMERELGWKLSPVFGLDPAVLGPVGPGAAGTPEGGVSAKRGGGDETSDTGLAGPASYPSSDGHVTPFFAALEAIAGWLGPQVRASRTVSVPDVCGLRASDAFYAVARADLHIRFDRLTENPAGGDGTVVDQDPQPGTEVRRHSALTVQVVYPTLGAAPV